MRKFGIFLLSVILLFSLLGFALSVSSNIALTHPSKVKSWLNQSNLYGSFISDAIKQAKQSAGGDSSNLSLNDAAVQQIASSTFSSKSLQLDVNTFVNSNYAWLEGKTNTPNFRIDLTNAKQTFADRVGDYAQMRLKNLSVCSDAQATQLSAQSVNPLSLPCRPVGVIPSSVATQVSDEIANSSQFLGDPVITASNLNPKGDNESQPYYQNLSGLPKVYQFGTKLPLIAGAIALGSAVGVIFLPKRHRNGWRIFAFIALLDGLLLAATKLIPASFFDKYQTQLFKIQSGGEVHTALTAFMRHADNQLTGTNVLIGAAYIVVAGLILIVLRVAGQRSVRPAFLRNTPDSDKFSFDEEPAPKPVRKITADDAATRLKRPPAAHTPTAPTAPPVPAKPKRRKPPKLIQ